jgi:hypothetical protein
VCVMTCDALLLPPSSLLPLLRYRRFFVPFLDTWEGDTHDCMNVLTLLFHPPVLRMLSSLVFYPWRRLFLPLIIRLSAYYILSSIWAFLFFLDAMTLFYLLFLLPTPSFVLMVVCYILSITLTYFLLHITYLVPS